MLDTKADLLERIRLGEDSFLELKEVRTAGTRITAPDRHDLADELAAFANTRGGVCVLGVDDKTRHILGIPLQHLDDVETFVRNIVTDNIKPPLPVIIEKLTLPTAAGAELPVLKVDIPRS
ncbi:MAG: ATP-binding protein, partial [Bryobacterales bacterium]|nr:ATP-binding protein [Bryobacterales bacterium]